MNTLKRILSLFLTLTLLCGVLALPVSAATVGNTSDQNTSVTVSSGTAAYVLYNLDLFRGTGDLPGGMPKLDLTDTATRAQAAVLIVRILGAENEALTKHYKHSFTDVPGWASDYVGYAVKNGIIDGITPTLFDPDTTIPANQFVTLVMRALGYTNVDYNNPFPAAASAGLSCSNTDPFTRGNMASVCFSALSCKLSGKSQTLIQQLVSKGSVSKVDAFYAGLFGKYQGFGATSAIKGEGLTNNYPGLSAISTKQQAIYQTLLMPSVCEIAIVEVSNASDVQKVKDIFQARIDDNSNTHYVTDAVWQDDSRIVSKGNFVMMVAFPGAADDIVADFRAQF